MDGTGRPGSTIGRLGRGTSVLVGVVALVAACSNAGGGISAPPATQAAGPSAASTMAAPTGVTLELAEAPDLGSYVAGKDGLALYVFLPDKGKAGSECNGDCAASWPPLTVVDAAEVEAGDGVTGQLGSFTRDDGTTQVTLNGAPLYYFSGDEAAGDVNGQGLNDVWYLASAEGTPVGDDDSPPAEETPCGGRYCY
jgi:predicted lipoprotein with Yx(FWY)xxD motif